MAKTLQTYATMAQDNFIQRAAKRILGINDKPKVEASYGRLTSSFAVSYNGEKNSGEIGPAKDYYLDYDLLRIRSWQSYLESDITQGVLNKYLMWVIGAGLKAQSEPNKMVLKSEGLDINTEVFNEVVEARFMNFSKSKRSDYCGMKSLYKLQNVGYKNAIIGGDVLVILRYNKKQGVTVQLVDGAHVCSPMYGSDLYAAALSNGNVVRHGIEMNKQGKHVAYYVRTEYYTFERIEAQSKATGLTMAYLVYGNEFRIDNHRGLPFVATVLETLKKLDRYKEATVGTAEETSKIAYQVVHQNYSTGENPLAGQLAKAFNADSSDDAIPVDVQGKQLADNVAATTQKQAYNMPIGSELKTVQMNAKELHFKEFYSTNQDVVCASIGIPPEVAMSKYDSNFSASRAALKDWQHTINVRRKNFVEEFLQPIYNLWLHVEILSNKVQAEGYINAFVDGNETILEAYRNVRFIGASIPHIDPLKEVNAVRAKLGALGKDIPLCTVEQATEELDGGDSDSNIFQFSEELKQAKELGVFTEVPTVENTNVED